MGPSPSDPVLGRSGGRARTSSATQQEWWEEPPSLSSYESGSLHSPPDTMFAYRIQRPGFRWDCGLSTNTLPTATLPWEPVRAPGSLADIWTHQCHLLGCLSPEPSPDPRTWSAGGSWGLVSSEPPHQPRARIWRCCSPGHLPAPGNQCPACQPLSWRPWRRAPGGTASRDRAHPRRRARLITCPRGHSDLLINSSGLPRRLSAFHNTI